MTVLLRKGVTTDDPRLDRIPRFDDKSRNFRVRRRLEGAPAARRRVYSKPGPTLDQGDMGGCTGWSTATRLNSRPYARKPLLTDQDAKELYFDAQRDDEWDGGEYPGASPVYSGSSVLGAMKAGVARGYFREYNWIGAGSGRVVDDLVDSLREVGGVVLGTNWMRSMFTPQSNGLLVIDKDSGAAGGHAYNAIAAVYVRLAGTPKKKLYVVIHNTWGDQWGVMFRGFGGHAFIDVEEGGLEWLLENDGEGAVPILG